MVIGKAGQRKGIGGGHAPHDLARPFLDFRAYVERHNRS
jgi:hypothetical protein